MQIHRSHRLIIGGLVLAAAVSACSPGKDNAATPPAAAPAPAPVAPATPPPVAEVAPASAASAAKVTLAPAQGGTVGGTLTLTPEAGGVRLAGTLSGLTPNAQQGFHIHEKGDCSAADFSSAGGHFNPDGHQHGKPESGAHHAGDMFNLAADGSGAANVNVLVAGVAVGTGAANDVVNRAVVVHAAADDYASQPAGNSGARVACGVIQS